MTTLVTERRDFWEAHVARQLVARGETVARAGEGVEQQPSDQRFALEYVTGDLRDAASLDRAMAGVQRVITLRRINGCGPRERRIFTISNVGGTKNLLVSGEASGRGAADLHQLRWRRLQWTGRNCRNEFTDAKLEEMVGHYKRFEVDGGAARCCRAVERRHAGDCGDADYAGGTLGLEADADGKDYSGFSEWEDARIRGDRTGILWEWKKCAAGHLLAGGARQGWRAIFAGSGEPDAEGLLDLLAKITGLRARR